MAPQQRCASARQVFGHRLLRVIQIIPTLRMVGGIQASLLNQPHGSRRYSPFVISSEAVSVPNYRSPIEASRIVKDPFWLNRRSNPGVRAHWPLQDNVIGHVICLQKPDFREVSDRDFRATRPPTLPSVRVSSEGRRTLRAQSHHRGVCRGRWQECAEADSLPIK